MRQTPPKTGIDRVLLQALVLVCVGVVIMVGNRWVVARQQADVVHDLLLANARGIVEHTVSDAAAGPPIFVTLNFTVQCVADVSSACKGNDGDIPYPFLTVAVA